jgi:hypothetical protein
VRSLSPVVGVGLVHNNFRPCSGVAESPAHYWVLRQHLCCLGLAGSGQVVSLHLGGGVWCLFNWIVVASIFKQNCCFL